MPQLHNTVDKSLPIPLYFQLEELILNQIRSGELQPGYKLPTEEWLSKTYGISRVTIRKTLDNLIAQGLLQRTRGCGPIVAETQVKTTRLLSLQEELTQQGITSSTKLLAITYKHPGGNILSALQAAPSETIVESRRLRFGDGKPVALQTSSVREIFCPGIDMRLLVNGSLYQTMEEGFGLQLNHAEQVVDAKPADKTEAGLLEVECGSPLIWSERVTFLSSSEAIEYSENLYVPGRHKLRHILYR